MLSLLQEMQLLYILLVMERSWNRSMETCVQEATTVRLGLLSQYPAPQVHYIIIRQVPRAIEPNRCNNKAVIKAAH